MKKFKNVGVDYVSSYFDIEISDEELEYAKKCGIDIDDDDELVRFHLENHFEEYQDYLHIENYEYESEEENEKIQK